MQLTRSIRRYSLVTLAALAALAGCAEERPPINQVQANALEKSFFVGQLDDYGDDPEFYKRGTIVDVGYGAGTQALFTSTYGQPLTRIRWEITEFTLNARLAYERISGTDSKGETVNGVERIPTTDGQIVASYAIQSHFDIRRDYNPQTGEELNVVVENTSDQPWYARKYFRVDWSKNLVTTAYDYDTLAQTGIYGGVDYEPIGYTVLDPSDPDAPHFDATDGYFDVTNKVYARPKMIDLSSLGIDVEQFPACWLGAAFSGGTEPYGNCNAIQLTLRESYKRVTDTDYEPMDQDGVRFQVLGAFNFSYRRGYDRSYGMLDEHWNRFLSRYNIWERSHFYADPENLTGPIACATLETTEYPTGDPTADPNRDADGNGTADECEAAGPGSRCDVYTQKCTLPYWRRESVTIPWYMSGDQRYFEPSDWAVQEWDLAMKTAVQTARLTECRRIGATTCDTAYPMWTGQQDDNEEAVRITREFTACNRELGWGAAECRSQARASALALANARGNPDDASTLAIAEIVAMPSVFVLCHSPVEEKDHPACGPRGLTTRLGDIRYHSVLAVENPQTPSPWGIMADADDPLTGEKIAGSMNVWTHVTDLQAQTLVDLVRYVEGQVATEQITNGQYVRDWTASAKLGGRGGLPTLTKAEINERLAATTALDRAAFETLTKAKPPEELKAVLSAGKMRVLDVAARNDVASPGLGKIMSTLASGRGTALEASLLNAPMLQLAGVPAGVPVDSTVQKIASPLALNNPTIRQRLREARENALAARGACILNEAPEPSGLTGLSEILSRKFPAAEGESPSDRQGRYERMLNYVRRHYHYAVMAHEMGHSVGLRHNFVSSSAPLFYRPQYWQLRTKNGTVTNQCEDAVDDGSGCVGPRYWDPVSDEEQSELIWMWMHSSVMDYPGELTQDMLGLGATDFAAARFFYADTTSVYTNPDYAVGTAIGTGISAATDTFGGLLGIRYGVRAGRGSGVEEFHYSALQERYGMIHGCYEMPAEQPATWREDLDGYWDPVLDGHVVSVDGVAKRCRQQPVDYVQYNDLRMPTPGELNSGFYRGGPSVETTTGRLRVPYSFATDHWADLGNVSVLRHDNGADPYEQAQFLISTQETRHIFDNYRRDRSTFSVREAADRGYSRYTSKLQGMAGAMAFLRSIYQDLSTNEGYSFDSLWPLIVSGQAPENMVASTVIFDHFVRHLSRPEPGEHYFRQNLFEDPVMHSAVDADDFGPPEGSLPLGQVGPAVLIPNGTTGYLRDVGFGGHPLASALSSTHGDFDTEYTENAGSYYDKINTAILFAESEDRFVSQSRRDFYDARFRAVGLADILPDGFRRVIGSALTGDRSLLAPHIVTNDAGKPLLDTEADATRDPLAKLYPALPLGWPSFWPPAGPEICFPSQGRNACTNYVGTGGFSPIDASRTAPIDPQIGWEVQKFLIAWTVSYIKANEKSTWLDMLRLYRVGADSNPELDQGIEWQDPTSGILYSAPTFGKECYFGQGEECEGGRLVERGIAARILEYANYLTGRGYQLDEASYPETDDHPAGFNEFGRAMFMNHPNGTPIVKPDPAVRRIAPNGSTLLPIDPCDQNDDPACKQLAITDNHFAYELQSYKSVPDFLWQAAFVYGLLDDPRVRGEY
ncbi:MAG TPA: hypothetical protein VGK73_00860 [Polyangiaceae bacterium]